VNSVSFVKIGEKWMEFIWRRKCFTK